MAMLYLCLSLTLVLKNSFHLQINLYLSQLIICPLVIIAKKQSFEYYKSRLVQKLELPRKGGFHGSDTI
ncbi:hypothetical protein TTHERM_000268128 (macronuclear) [Tetrahymena thermophila SB210]|uniref:Uncharacterized protein n=1 Tax=Tetrahymena thermophila (strain SB210) TaxID=312017 RepID=W7X4X4_TETTS|nr:hypothetical protein TTHERM_000268128 [Tetrahymena thermophila SB210]EWS74385.1 hypothetical protein TTHERM_000268128 [Tetrahymena thermophila SB210]|eukprot:XP_012653062.1 hypothetical protein TTHERM_000268128 [Tetrahymena thermophila SB210]